MTQLVGALVSVHDALAVVTNLDSLPDPPCVLCKNCQKVYIGETGQSFGVCMKEHGKEVEQ